MKSRKSIQAAEYSEFLKKSPSVEEVLSHEKTVDEFCCLNPELNNYINSGRLREIIHFIIDDPDDPNDFIRSCKFPMVASELFVSDLEVINKVLLNDLSLMKYLFSFVMGNKEINYLQAGYFQKVFECLNNFDSAAFGLILFGNDFQSGFLRYLKSSCIADILMSILQMNGFLDERICILSDVTALIGSDDKLVSFNASAILTKVNRENDCFQFFMSDSTAESLIKFCSSDKKWVIRNGGIVLKYLLGVVPETLVPFLKKNIKLLSSVIFGSSFKEINTQFGGKIKAFGEERLVFLDIFSSLATHSLPELTEYIPGLLEMFPDFIWNSYFHNSFIIFIESIIASQNADYILCLSNSRFFNTLILLAEDPCTVSKVSIPKGFLGHVYKLINLLSNSQIPDISGAIKHLDSWTAFEARLSKYNEIETNNIGGKVNINILDNLSSDSTEKADEIDLIPDYSNSKPITGKDLEELTDLFDLEDKTQKSSFMATKVVQTATLEELRANEFLECVFWKIEVKVDNLEKLD